MEVNIMREHVNH